MLVESFLQDLRIGLRVLIKEKGFCALAVTVLALGICGVATMFSVVNGVMLRGFSFPNAARLTSIQFIDPAQTNFFGVASQTYGLDYQEIAASQKSFEMVAAYISGSTVNVTHKGAPQRYTGAYITEDFLKILGVAPIKGRDFSAEDNRPGAAKVALISHRLWQRDFGGSADIVGTAIRLNGRPTTIVGVMPVGFAFPVNEEWWIPLFNEFPPQPRNDRSARANTPTVIALIKRDVTVQQAGLEMSGFAQRLAREFPDTNQRFKTALVQPLIDSFIPQQLRGLLYSMLAVCAGVLLLACANVMNMQFARATLRAKELAIRSSLGATRRRLVRQMLTESLLLAVLGAGLGVVGAFYCTDLLMATVRNLPNPIPAYITFDIDLTVLGGVVITTMLAAVVSGVIPAWMASRADPVEVLKESGRGHTSRAINFITRGLVVFQIVVTCVILIASLLQVQAIFRQQRLDYGYDTTAVLTARMGLMAGPFNNPNVEEVGFYLPFFSTTFGPAAPAPVATPYGTIVVRPRNARPGAFAHALRREALKADPHLPLYFVGTPKEGIDSFLGQNRIIAIMFSIFGAVAMLMAAVGLYGVMSFAVNQRTQEFGIRLVLGADHRRILGMVVRQGTIQIAAGLAIGLSLAISIALLGGQGVRDSLAGVISPTDPATYAVVTALLAGVSFLATLIPARRATRVDPIVALRAE